jgi:RHS repeat-associated protein
VKNAHFQAISAYPFGMEMPGRQNAYGAGVEYRYAYNGMEVDGEVSGDGNSYTTEFRQYDPRLGRWKSLDPLMHMFASISPYASFDNNSVFFTDLKGDRPLPVNSVYNGMGWRIDSGFGSRSCSGCSKFHRGVDLNTTGGGSTDLGAPVLATHSGVVSAVHDNTNGGGGRYIQIKSPDGTFASQYLHLSEITVILGQTINEGDVIGKVGGSANGSETGRPVHLHYELMLINEDGGLTKIDPLVDIDQVASTNNLIINLVDPQKWITGELLLGTKTVNPNFTNTKPIEMELELEEVIILPPKQSLEINKLPFKKIEPIQIQRNDIPSHQKEGKGKEKESEKKSEYKPRGKF